MISLNVAINAEDLIENLLDQSDLDPGKFILSLDEAIADEGFTLDLISELTKPLIRDNNQHLEFLASKSLEQNFNPEVGPISHLYRRNYSAEWEKQQTLCKNLSQIEKLLNAVLEDYGIL